MAPQVWNETDKPRLVLIFDIWHPQLVSDDERCAALENDNDRKVYLGVVRDGAFYDTIERGH